MQRANNTCEFEGCDFKHLEEVWSVKHKGRSNWFRDFEVANSQPKSTEIKKGIVIENPKKVKVILTIAHLFHDETNIKIKDDCLMAMCQLHHLRYDSSEKFRRIQNKNK